MVVASPRTQFRGAAPIIADDPESDFERRTVAALRQLQEHMLLFPTGIRTLTASATMIDTDALILANATSGDVTVTLLTAKARTGRDIFVKKTDSSANAVIIDPEGSETLDGAATISLLSQNAVRGYRSDGTNWRLISSLGNASGL
jgi:hypothetical protein